MYLRALSYRLQIERQVFLCVHKTICQSHISYGILRDDLKERRGYSHLKEEALDRTMWIARFGRFFGPVVRQTTK